MKQPANKALSALLAAALTVGTVGTFGVPTAAAAGSSYKDTQGHWAESSIQRWSSYGVISGYDADSFGPNNSITRGQMAKILSNALNLSESAGNPFSDVNAGDWFAPFVSRCYAAGIMQGNNGMANPNSTITRQQAMTMLARALGVAPDNGADLSAFSDRGQVADYAAPYVSAMVKSGMVGGTGDGKLSPGGSMTRAALVTVLDRAVVQYITQPGTYTLSDQSGIILVASSNVTLNGSTSANIVITPAANNGTVFFEDATVRGTVTVQANYATVSTKNSSVPNVTLTGTGSTVKEASGTTTAAGSKRQPGASGSSGSSSTGGGSSSGGSSSGGSSNGGNNGGNNNGGNTTPGTSDTTVIESQEQADALANQTVKNLTISGKLGDGDVSLENVTINGNLSVEGGGTHTIKLLSCNVSGKVIMNKDCDSLGYYEVPRLLLENTKAPDIDVKQPAIISTRHEKSDNEKYAINSITASADVTIWGENTTIANLKISGDASAKTNVTIDDAKIDNVEITSPTALTARCSDMNPPKINNMTVISELDIDIDISNTIIEIPENAENVQIHVRGYHPYTNITIVNHSANDVKITSDGGSSITFDGNQDNIDFHTHEWDKSDWMHDDNYHWHVCKTCGEMIELEKEEHAFDSSTGIITTKPTLTTPGVETFTCTCGVTTTREWPCLKFSDLTISTENNILSVNFDVFVGSTNGYTIRFYSTSKRSSSELSDWMGSHKVSSDDTMYYYQSVDFVNCAEGSTPIVIPTNGTFNHIRVMDEDDLIIFDQDLDTPITAFHTAFFNTQMTATEVRSMNIDFHKYKFSDLWEDFPIFAVVDEDGTVIGTFTADSPELTLPVALTSDMKIYAGQLLSNDSDSSILLNVATGSDLNIIPR